MLQYVVLLKVLHVVKKNLQVLISYTEKEKGNVEKGSEIHIYVYLFFQ